MPIKILYAVLNWGLGHATRSIPIIKQLIDEGFEVVLASDGLASDLLKKEFPSLQMEEAPAYDVIYSKDRSSFNLQLATQIPKFIKAIKDENIFCKNLCEKYQIDKIISDNRYGFYSKNIKSALICHQLVLLYPQNFLFEKLVNKSYQSYLKEFDQLWVPDFPSPNTLSGKMSQLDWQNKFYIGAASRLEKELSQMSKFKNLAILSGPEPQRSILEGKLNELFSSMEGQHYIVRGTNEPREFNYKDNVDGTDLLDGKSLALLIAQSQQIICRSGYTSIIDMLKIDKACLLIPTPGQVEQEYLAKELDKKFKFRTCTQEELSPKQLAEREIHIEDNKLNFAYNFRLIQEFLLC